MERVYVAQYNAPRRVNHPLFGTEHRPRYQRIYAHSDEEARSEAFRHVQHVKAECGDMNLRVTLESIFEVEFNTPVEINGRDILFTARRRVPLVELAKEP